MIKPTSFDHENCFVTLDIPFKTMIKPTESMMRYWWRMLDIPFKTMIKPTGMFSNVFLYRLDIPFKTMIKPTVGYTIQNNDKTNPVDVTDITAYSWIYHSKQ